MTEPSIYHTMVDAYNTTGDRMAAVKAVQLAYPHEPVARLIDMWEAIDAYVDSCWEEHDDG